MSKNKPKETIEYVIRLQDKERQLLDDAIGAYRFGRIADPIVSIIKDNSALLVVSSLLVLLLPNLPPNWRETLEGLGEGSTSVKTIKDWLELENLAGAVAGGWGGAWAGAGAGPWGALIGGIAGAISGMIAVEVGEEVGEALFDSDYEAEVEAAKTGNAISGTAVLMYLIITLERIGNRNTI